MTRGSSSSLDSWDANVDPNSAVTLGAMTIEASAGRVSGDIKTAGAGAVGADGVYVIGSGTMGGGNLVLGKARATPGTPRAD